MSSELPSFFVALPAALAAMAFMFQTRHHNLHSHEEEINKEIRAIIDADLRLINEAQLNFLIDERDQARKRYNYALRAFIGLMFSVPFSLLALILAPYNPTYGFGTLVFACLVAGIAFVLHIFFDLWPAKRHQSIIRSRLDEKLTRLANEEKLPTSTTKKLAPKPLPWPLSIFSANSPK